MIKQAINVGSHVEDLADGRSVAPGETVKSVDETEPHNARLFEEGVLLDTATASDGDDKKGDDK